MAIAALRDVARLGSDLPWHVTYDLADFYCAGEALNQGRNPYAYEPLRSCEHRVDATPELRADPAIARPAPQPPYDFPAFMALARLPYPMAQQLWSIAIVAALIVTAFAAWRLALPAALVVPSLVLSAGFAEIDAGQIVPFALCALVICGMLLAQRRDALAGVFAAITAIEPHLGGPVILATLLFVPRARATVLAVGVVAIAATAVALGPSVWITYVTQVLPAHAGAELGYALQFSLTYALHFFGASDTVALAAGSAGFIVATVLGVVCAPIAGERLGRRELLVFLPAAAAVTGGVFVHAVELCFAIPAAIVLAVYGPGRWRVAATVALAALTVPWILVWGIKKLWIASIAVVAAIFYGARTDTWFAAASTLGFATVIYLLERVPPKLPTPPALAATAFPPNALVQTEWRALIATLEVHDPLWLVVKIPAWCALVAILGIGLRCAFGRPAQSQPLP